MTGALQRGIYFEPRAAPARCFRLLLLNIDAGVCAQAASAVIARLLEMLQALKGGDVRELAGQPPAFVADSRAQFESLDALVAYGRRLFDDAAHAPPLTRADRPEFLAYLGPTPFPRVPIVSEPAVGEADVALQLTAANDAAVNCAAVECWKLIVDEELPCQVVATYCGFGRTDRRGWLEFHDGVSNIESAQRRAALEAPADPAWMAGGTYMAFLRLAVDLQAWRRLSRPAQELIVGRDKLSGSALVGTCRGAGGAVEPVAAPPLGGEAAPEERAMWRDPPQTLDAILERSHIHRANQSRASPAATGGFRIYRQGYDYFDGFADGVPQVGLNFVSFQSDLRVLQQIMHLPGWLGDANFGGENESDIDLIRLVAGGLYAVPPAGEPFPGEQLFRDQS